MGRIVVLAGSPRREGNTELLARAFAGAAGRYHEVELLSVADGGVHPCLGCNRCYGSESHRCVQEDGMVRIYDSLQRADALVLASPVYFYGVSAQLKAVVDRLHTPLRNSFPIRRLGLILVGAAELPALFDDILTQYRLVLDFFHLEDMGTVLVRGAKDKGDVLRGDGPGRARALGESTAAWAGPLR